MARFAVIKTPRGEDVAINLQHVFRLERHGSDQTKIIFAVGNGWGPMSMVALGSLEDVLEVVASIEG